jgi:phospholipase D1/2
MKRQEEDAAGGAAPMPGRNCGRIERAHRRYAAVRSAIAQAKRTVFILGWDFDRRTRLGPPAAKDDYPEASGEFLEEAAQG